MLKLYDYWRSSASYRVRMALHFKEIPFESIAVHLVNNGGEQHTTTYQKINPNELVPTLELENGTHISQSLAILQYLDDRVPGKPLFPSDMTLKYKALELSMIIGCDLHPLTNLRVLQYLKNELGASDGAASQWYRHWLEKGFHSVEQRLTEWKNSGQTQGPFAFGDCPCIADVFIAAQYYNAQRFNIPTTPYPLIDAIAQHCLQQTWLQQAYPSEN